LGGVVFEFSLRQASGTVHARQSNASGAHGVCFCFEFAALFELFFVEFFVRRKNFALTRS
jgi:hypothetical protein